MIQCLRKKELLPNQRILQYKKPILYVYVVYIHCCFNGGLQAVGLTGIKLASLGFKIKDLGVGSKMALQLSGGQSRPTRTVSNAL